MVRKVEVGDADELLCRPGGVDMDGVFDDDDVDEEGDLETGGAPVGRSARSTRKEAAMLGGGGGHGGIQEDMGEGDEEGEDEEDYFPRPPPGYAGSTGGLLAALCCCADSNDHVPAGGGDALRHKGGHHRSRGADPAARSRKGFFSSAWLAKYASRWTLLSVAVVVMMCTVIIPFSAGWDSWTFGVMGGGLGLCSCFFIFLSYYFLPECRRHPSPLLFYRAIADSIVAMTFLLSPLWMQRVCGDVHCELGDSRVHGKDCQVPSSVLETFELASEGWFFCVVLDLFYTLRTPFVSHQHHMKQYHLLAWSLGLGCGIIMFFNADSYGQWYVDKSKKDDLFCWFRSDSSTDLFDLNYWTWALFYIPVLGIYIAAIMIVFYGYRRLRQGLSKTFAQRLHILAQNATNLLVYGLYWIFIQACHMIAYITADNGRVAPANTLFEVVIFGISAKGFVDLIVWILVVDLQAYLRRRSLKATLDPNYALKPHLNKALTDEILFYATSGIRKTAERVLADEGEPRLQRLYMRPRSSTTAENRIPLRTFLRLMLGLSDGAASGPTPSHRPHRGSDMSSTGSVATVDHESVRHGSRSHASSTYGGGGGGGERGTHSTKSSFRLSSKFGGSDTAGGRDRISVDSQVSDVSFSERTSTVSVVEQCHMTDQGLVCEIPGTAGADDRVSRRGAARKDGGSGGPTTMGGGDDEESIFDEERGDVVPPLRQQQPTTSTATASSGATGAMRDSMSHRHRYSQAVRDTISRSYAYAAGAVGARDGNEWSSTRGQTAPCACLAVCPCTADPTDGLVVFEEYLPITFRRVRAAFSISDEVFMSSFKSTIKEQITEGGASGAFFFFSGNERFIAKSCTEEEMTMLLHIAKRYASFVSENPNTYLSRILGAYRLSVYSNSFAFLVMANIFAEAGDFPVNQKYDIKGSWENRSAAPPRSGQQVTCRHCNRKFVYLKTKKQKLLSMVNEPCPMTGNGIHAPNQVFKDNDLNWKIRLDKPVADAIRDQLYKDADFLASMNIMDYSLLLGVHNVEYVVEALPDEGGEVDENAPLLGVLPECGELPPGIHSTSEGTQPANGMPFSTMAQHLQEQRQLHPQERAVSTDSNGSVEAWPRPAAPNAAASIATAAKPRSAGASANGAPARGAGSTGLHFAGRTTTGVSATLESPGSVKSHGSHSSFNFSGKDRISMYSMRGESRGRVSVRNPMYRSLTTDVVSFSMSGSRIPAKRIPGASFYLLGVIDVLQPYNAQKKIELWWKSTILRKETEGISSQDPRTYVARFKRKIQEIIVPCEEDD